MLVALGGTKLLRQHWPARFSSDPSGWLRALDVDTLRVDPAALVFAGVLALATALLFGVLPAMRLSGTTPADALRSVPGRWAAAGPMRGRSVLVSCQVALALMLLIGAGLMTASLIHLLAVDRGFEEDGLLMFRYTLTRGSDDDAAIAERHARFLARLAQDPRIEAAGLSSCPAPLSGWCRRQVLQTRGDIGLPEESLGPRAGVHRVSEGYFEALGTRVLEGRTFADADGLGAEPVAILNRSAARALFGDASPIGRALPVVLAENEASAVVVGVVEDVLQARPELGQTPEIYLPFRQEPSVRATAFVRTSARPLQLVPELSAYLEALEPGSRIASPDTGAQLIAGVTTDRRALLWLMAVFAGSALALTALGIWSVVAYAASQRTREIGVRMALGARGYQVVGLVARAGGAAVLTGILIGLAGAYLASRAVRAIVFGVEPTEPTVYAAASVVLALVALAASIQPALRATRIDPVRAIRME
jgi:putative ABC transport system permease protein